MLVILSPAKSMDTSLECEIKNITTAQFEEEAGFLASKMSAYDVQELQKLLKISPALAQSTFERYGRFCSPDTKQLPALRAYTGSVYKEIDVNTFSQADFDYCQQNLRIISVLYGLVRPLDSIKAYRLEYKLKLEGLEGDLYRFWQSKLSSQLVEDVKSSGGTLINLASLDVLPALDMEHLKREVTIITPEFKTLKNGKYEVIRTYTKIARGAMARYILKNRITEPEELKRFEFRGYKFNDKISTPDNFIYTL